MVIEISDTLQELRVRYDEAGDPAAAAEISDVERLFDQMFEAPGQRSD